MADSGGGRRAGGLGRASALLASGTLVSRALGFANNLILAWTIGLTFQGADAFTLANGLPNAVYAIVAGGLLNAVLVPQIVRAASHDDGGQAFVNKIVTAGTSVFVVISLATTLAAPLLVRLYAQDGGSLDERGLALATALAYWCLPQVFFYALYSLLGEVLNARGVFGPFTWAPVANNIVAIAGLVVFAALFGVDPAHRDPDSWDATRIALLGGTSTLGVAAQALVLLLFWRRTGLSFRPDFRWRGVGLGKTSRAAGWIFGMVLVSQIAGVVQSNVATLAGEGEPSLAILRNSWIVFMLPFSVFAVSILTPFFTRMSGHAHSGDLDSLRRDLSTAVRVIGMIVVGVGMAMIAAALPFAVLFASELRDARAMALVIVIYLVGLLPFCVLYVLQRSFYALENTRTPFLLNCVQGAIFSGLALVVAGFDGSVIAYGLAGALTIASAVHTIVAALALRHRMRRLDGRLIVRRLLVFTLVSLPAGAVGLLTLWVLGGFDEGFAVSGRLAGTASAAVVGSVTLAVYLLGIRLTRVPEFDQLAGPVLRRLRRGRAAGE